MKLKNSRLLIIRQLDKKIQLFMPLSTIQIPPTGWISTLRKSLNMSLKQLGQKMTMSAQGVKDLENREAEGSISINSLKAAGEALNMKLVYGFIPKDSSLEEMIEKKARIIAVEIVKRTSITMSLEDQANSNERLKQAIEEMTLDIKKDVPKSLWD
ncbi:mobile mystery protein A [Pedobacter sp. N36a]|uniref:mobile mystery protein A n=1 Tax=Pedobacter sp. N36a TaxID=2767996 RepID=UPI0016576379|nr:mobile mystery protein A [Pedobacter sp. N36a]MBC8986159.1 mobile mystery protein A [Pedobacter sp. N36a]